MRGCTNVGPQKLLASQLAVHVRALKRGSSRLDCQFVVNHDDFRLSVSDNRHGAQGA